MSFFGYSPTDNSPIAVEHRKKHFCPFLKRLCTKKLRNGELSGACSLETSSGKKVICCPIRLYADDYAILSDVASVAFGTDIDLVPSNSRPLESRECIVVFGKGWGKELRLPNRGRAGSYFVDWVLAHVDAQGELVGFVAVEVQSIDTTGNYGDERKAYLKGENFKGKSTAGLNWENVNKRILPQIIYKGHVLRQEPLCAKGLFFVCPTPVYEKVRERLGGDLRSYSLQPGALTLMWYDIDSEIHVGQIRALNREGEFTTTIDQVALAFTSPSNLPPAGVYENAIRSSLEQS